MINIDLPPLQHWFTIAELIKAGITSFVDDFNKVYTILDKHLICFTDGRVWTDGTKVSVQYKCDLKIKVVEK